MRRILLVVGLVAGVAALAAGCGDGDDAGASGCADVDAPAPRADGSERAPTEKLDPAQTYTLTFETSCGTFVVTLDQKLAPNTTASLVSLARKGFFDDTVFHRIVVGFVIQGGDPLQNGSGGPGYQTVDVPKQDAAYTHGVVAMAKGSAEPPGTSGSQFFIVTAAEAPLPPDYAIVGEVTEGLAVVDEIGTLGDEAEQPTQAVVVDKVTVGET
ncbi:MAG: peptidylprolyl isomerase [Gaiellales bacterium]